MDELYREDDDEDEGELEVREVDTYEFMTGTRTRKTEDE
jgi:hypothetical protein